MALAVMLPDSAEPPVMVANPELSGNAGSGGVTLFAIVAVAPLLRPMPTSAVKRTRPPLTGSPEGLVTVTNRWAFEDVPGTEVCSKTVPTIVVKAGFAGTAG